jgi:Domain of unknown function (DUF4139)
MPRRRPLSVLPLPVRLEYLAAVVQQTGESWPGVRVTLSTARPSLPAGSGNGRSALAPWAWAEWGEAWAECDP